jgi:hypothetical protein
VPAIEAYLKSLLGTDKASLYVGIAITILSLYVYYFNVVTPLFINDRYAKNRWKVIKRTVDDFIKAYKGQMEINVNILVTKRVFFRWIEPSKTNPKKRKFSFYADVFDLYWADEDGGFDKRMRFTTNQGLCGAVYNEKRGTKAVAFTPDFEHSYNFNFTDEQQALTSELVILASCPIKVFEYEAKQKKAVFGVLNVESKTPASKVWMEDSGKRAAFMKSVDDLESYIRNLI